MYAGHPIAMNPFRSAFAEIFLRERDMSRAEAECGGVSENEQLVWVLWKILKGDGNDVSFLATFNYDYFCLEIVTDLLGLLARTVFTCNSCPVTSSSKAPCHSPND